jgi:hypothetical protein
LIRRGHHVQAQGSNDHPVLPADQRRQAQADPVKHNEAVLLDQERMMTLVQQKANLLERRALIEVQLSAVEAKMLVLSRRIRSVSDLVLR